MTMARARRASQPSRSSTSPNVAAHGVGKNEYPESVVTGPEVGRAKTVPFRIEPELGQVSENTAKCSQVRPSVPGISHASRAGFQTASGCS